MKKKSITVEENGFGLKDGRSMIFKIIDSQISNYKLQFLTEWERNHNMTLSESNKKVQKLENAKKDLQEFFNIIQPGDGELSFKLNLEVQFKDNETKTLANRELMLS